MLSLTPIPKCLMTLIKTAAWKLIDLIFEYSVKMTRHKAVQQEAKLVCKLHGYPGIEMDTLLKEWFAHQCPSLVRRLTDSVV